MSPHSLRSRRLPAVTSALAGVVAGVTATAVLAQWSLTQLPPWEVTRVEDAVSAVMVWAAAALVTWLTLGSLLALGSSLPGVAGAVCSRLERLLAPRFIEKALAALIGSTVATLTMPAGAAHGSGPTRPAGNVEEASRTDSAPTVGSPATVPSPALRPVTPAPHPGLLPPGRALPEGSSPDHTHPAGVAVPSHVPLETAFTSGELRVTSQAPSPGWRPTPPPRVADPAESRLLAPTPRTDTGNEAAVTVRRGDTLWHIAARHLGPGATEAEIAREWPRWHEANRDVIGADADLLLPGQQLRPPAPTTGTDR